LDANRLIKFCDVSLSYGVIEHAKTHEESKGAFLTFQKENTMTRRELDHSSGTAGDFIQDNEPQGNRVICHINDSIPEVIEAMRACVRETGASKLLSAIVTVDDPVERSLVASMSVSCKTRIRN
jgi:hypothetical protein